MTVKRNLASFVDFGAHVGVGEVAGDEGGADGLAEFFEGAETRDCHWNSTDRQADSTALTNPVEQLTNTTELRPRSA